MCVGQIQKKGRKEGKEEERKGRREKGRKGGSSIICINKKAIYLRLPKF